MSGLGKNSISPQIQHLLHAVHGSKQVFYVDLYRRILTLALGGGHVC